MIQNSAQRAPHQGGSQPFPHHAPNAALLIDFDNVTMGIRSDLGKELKALLNSEVIRGKVAVQRAYADWRRYPQYIVPLAESSIDLIFAPAYGSSKKNATDLRMAIDAIELVFTRPEIGTYILMTGDSDFSSCVLKLKEYGKYVIGVGMRESSSDLLVQNCDEYYSYHALSGLTRTDEAGGSAEDPWVLLKRAAQQMAAKGDVMRTDRLKQVMLELDPGFDEKALGYSKFSRFVQEASGKGVVRLRKGENGQYEIALDEESEVPAAETAAVRGDGGDGRRRRGRDRGRDEGRREPRPVVAEPVAAAAAPESAPEAKPEVAAAEESAAPAAGPVATLEGAYGLLQLAVRELGGPDGNAVRDGDVKRKMMDLSPGFDETDLGFSKFTRFLRQAHDAEAIDLSRVNGGNYEVSLPEGGKKYSAPQPAARKQPAPTDAAPEAKAGERERPAAREATAQQPAKDERAAAAEPEAAREAQPVRKPAVSGGVGALRGRRGGRGAAAAGPPPLLPGQVVAPTAGTAPSEVPPVQDAEAAPETAPVQADTSGAAEAKAPARRSRSRGRKAQPTAKAAPAPAAFSPADLGLPRERESIAAYLTNSYKGVGKKTAEALLETFGEDVFRVMQEETERVPALLGARRAEGLLEQWRADHERRSAEATPTAAEEPAGEPEEKPRAKRSRKPRAKAESSAAEGGQKTGDEAGPKPKPRTRRGGRGGRTRKKEPSAS